MARLSLRGLSAALIIIFAILALVLLTSLAGRFLDLQERLAEQPAAVSYGVYALIGLVVVLAAFFLTRLFWPKRSRTAAVQPVNEDALRERIATADAAGVDTRAANATLAARGEKSTLHFVVFGEVSAGKSSIIKALVPEADVEVSPLAGSTVSAKEFRWQAPAGVEVALADMPGLGSDEATNDTVMTQALHAHLVIYVCDADLTASDMTALQRLVTLDKPLVIVLNKADYYADDELERLLGAIHERVLSLNPDNAVTVVPVVAGGEERVIEITGDGDERTTTRVRTARIDELLVTLNHLVRSDASSLNLRRDQTLFTLATEELVQAEAAYRGHRASEIVRSHTRKAVLGAMAAVSPGTDVVIQGYLGHSLVKALTDLYDQRLADVEIDRLLDLSQSRVGKALPVALAIAGNALKAFPGLGTVGGGLVHAVAYGLIFDAIGRSLASHLETRKSLDAESLANDVEHRLADPLEARVARIARIALTRDQEESR